MALQNFQITKLMIGLPKFSPAVISGIPYVAPDLWVGDSLDLNPATVTAGFPIPSPLYTQTATVAGVSKGDATTYVVASGDATKDLTVTQTSANSQGTVSATSSIVNPVVAQKPWDMDLVGGNCSNPTYFSSVQFVNNAGQCGKAFQAYSSTGSPTTNYTGGLDANGWPTSTFSYVLTAQIGGRDGQLPAGTYQCSFRSVGQATNLVPSACAGATVTIGALDGDGVTTHYQLVIPIASNVVLSFDGGIQYNDVPRDGITPTWSGPEFWAYNLAFFSQFSVLRTMDLCNPNNNTESVWADRNTNRPEYSPIQPGNTWSWDRIFRWIKAVLQYPGSRVKKVLINPPGYTDVTQPNATNYSYQLAVLASSILGNLALTLEWGNEPWNNAFLLVAQNRLAAQVETQCLCGYPFGAGVTLNQIASIVSNGGGVATVTLNYPLNAVQLTDGSTFAITNGMQMVMSHLQANATWGAGSITPDPNNATNGTLIAATVTVSNPTGTTFTYQTNGTPTNGTAVGAPSGSNQYAFYFNLSSTLVSDGNSFSVFSVGDKLQVRRAYQAWQKWTSVRATDTMFLGLSQASFAVAGPANTSPVQYPYAKYMGGGSNSWCLGTAVAPYVKPTGLTFSGVGTAGGTTITGVPWASTAIVGDQINIGGAGVAGATLSTTVAAGSSGTTLVIANTISTTVTAANSVISYVACPQSSTIVGSITGTTLTVTSGSGIQDGMMYNGNTGGADLVVFNTRIGTQLTGTAGGAGTYSITPSQNTGGSVSMVFVQTDGLVNAINGSLGSFAATLAIHIFNNKKWGWRPMVYEGGPDTQAFPTQQIAINSNPSMQTVVTNLLASWFNQDGKEFSYYWIAPTAFSNANQGGWASMQTYADTASPKYAAVVGYASQPLAMSNIYGAPGTFAPGGSAGSYVQTNNQEQFSMSFNSVNGMLYGTTNANDRYVGVGFIVPRGRRYAITASGSDSALTTVTDVYVDNIMVGTLTLPSNGSASSNGTVPGNTNTLQLGELSRGSHNIRLFWPAGRGTTPGVFSISLSKY